MKQATYPVEKILEQINKLNLDQISDIATVIVKEIHFYTEEEIKMIYKHFAERIIELKY